MISYDILLKMLEISIEGLIENEVCSYCKIAHSPDYRCQSGAECSDLIFDRLKEIAMYGG